MPSPGNIRFDAFMTAGQAADYTESSSAPYRMLLLADFGGKTRPAEFKPLRIDRDNFDALPGQWSVEMVLPGLSTGGDLTIPIRELDDFTPDRLLQTIPALLELSQLRRQLGHPATFEKAAKEIRAWTGTSDEPESPKVEVPKSGADLLAGILGEAPDPMRDAGTDVESDFARLLRRTVHPHLIPAADARQADLENRVDAVMCGMLAAILHHPRFQAVEAAWRGLGFLVKRLDTDEAVHLFAADMTRDELAQDLIAPQSKINKHVQKLIGDGKRLSLVVGDYEFQPTAADATLLGQIGAAIAASNALFIAAAGAAHVGCESFVEQPDSDRWTGTIDPESQAAWKALRRRSEASFLGLVAPRFLLRSPYGRNGREVESMQFEELELAGPKDLLWGNGAIAWACLIGLAVGKHGPNFGNQVDDELGDIPTATTESAGNRETVPCAEAMLDQTDIEKIQDRGINVLSSIRDSDRIRLMSMRRLGSAG